MARKLKEFQFKVDDDKAKLPWNFWLNGEIWEVPLSDTNYSSLEGLRATIHIVANRRELKVKTHVDKEKDALIFQAYNPEE